MTIVAIMATMKMDARRFKTPVHRRYMKGELK